MQIYDAPRISAIVPIYKVPEKYLRKCIESLMNQTMKNIEMILVDDESPDNCGEICDEYAKQDSRIVVIHQKNKGLCGARNSGVKIAKAEWITFIDGDDWIETNCFNELDNELNKDIDILCFGSYRENGDNIKNFEYDLFDDRKVYKTAEELQYMQMMIFNFKSNISSVWGKIINKNFMINNNIYHNEILRQGAEDIEFTTRLFGYAKKIEVVKKYYYHYIYNNQSISAVSTEKNNYMVLNCFKEIKNNLDINNQELMKWYYFRLLYVIVTTAISGYFNPQNEVSYKEKKEKFKRFMNEDIIKETMKTARIKDLDMKRKIIIICTKYKMYGIIDLLAKIRRKQKDSN